MIRIANINDHKRLTDMFVELHRHHVEIKPEAFRMPGYEWFSDKIAEILDDDKQTVFVHENGGELNGYAVVKIIDVNTEEKIPRRMCYIDCFAVAENVRHTGIGTELFKAVNTFGKEHGCTSIQLGVTACNENAVKFYEKMGLVPRTITMEERL